MKTAGIIAEYNPFHNGHIRQIETLRKMGYDRIVAIISENFTQRAEPAVFDKFYRAKAALEFGCDLVLSMPFVYSAQSADIFAYAGVGILNKIGIDTLAFGAETVDTVLFEKVADILYREDAHYQGILRRNIKNGVSFAVSTQNALHEYTGMDMSFLKQPNNILAMCYYKSAKRIGADFSLLPMERNTYHQRAFHTENEASSSYIRKLLARNREEAEKFYPQRYFKNAKMHCTEEYRDIYKAFLALTDSDYLGTIACVEVGLGNRMLTICDRGFTTVDDFLDKVSNKRITKVRVGRILLNALLGYTQEQLDFYRNYVPGYVRVLAFNENGKSFLRKNERIFYLTNVKKQMRFLKEQDRFILQTEQKADRLYHLFDREGAEDEKRAPLICIRGI